MQLPLGKERKDNIVSTLLVAVFAWARNTSAASGYTLLSRKSMQLT